MQYIDWDDLFGEKRFMPWSKENEIWRTFYRTTVAGHWSLDDVEEFRKCLVEYEIHLDHGRDDDAHLFCQRVVERCQTIKAAKVSKLAVNDMKVIIMLGSDRSMMGKIGYAAKAHGFKLARTRERGSQLSQNEIETRKKVAEYLESLRLAFAPMAAGRRPKS